MHRHTRFALAAAVSIVCTGALQSYAAETGDRWTVTSSVTMGTMAMPSHTGEVCASRQPGAAPVKTESNCNVSDVKRVGNKQSLKMHCSGNPPMDGTMEITYDRPDHYRGQMTMSTQGGQMVMNMEGQKLPGDCDPGAQKRQVEAMVAQQNAQSQQAMQATCSKGARSVEYASFLGAQAICKDADSVKAYCQQVKSHPGFLKLAAHESDDGSNMAPQFREAFAHPLTGSAKLCGLEVPQLRSQLCASAEGEHQFGFLAEQCPDQARALAQRECAGREMTALSMGPYSEFCGRYASQGARAGAAAAGAGPAAAVKPAASDEAKTQETKSASDKAKDAVNKGANALKGLFGH